MPFLIRPPLHSPEADDSSLVLTLIDPDHNDRSMLQDLKRWDWRITRHNFEDEEFIEALKEIEQDLKRRRRHSHTVGNDLVGYTARPTLEELWHDEAEKKLMEEAYEEEKEEQRLKVEQEAKGNWFKHIDRTHQTNGFLDYVDHERGRPRLVTRGLAHDSSTTSFREPARSYYFDNHRHHRTARIHSTALPSHPRNFRSYIKKPTTIWSKPPDEDSEIVEDKNFKSICVTTDIQVSPVPDSPPLQHEPVPASIPLPPSPSINSSTNLIFPGSDVSPGTYIQHTNTGLSRTSPPLPNDAPPLRRASLGHDLYGWDAWDESRQSNEITARESAKFCLSRRYRSMSSRAREREVGEGADGRGG